MLTKPENPYNKLFQNGLLTDNLQNFGQLYIETRKIEGRIYTDEQVLKLPYIDKNHKLSKEWKIRAHSSKLLKKYLETGNSQKNILELGCGNGWLSNFLAQKPETEIYGIDINRQELEQAERVFGLQKNLHFIYGDIFDPEIFTKKFFDYIVLASVIQYFPDIVLLITHLQTLLNPNGEIHIIDSPFYKKEKLEEARLRSVNYYTNIGSPEMAKNYFQHNLDDLKEIFDLKVLFDPGSLNTKIKKLFFKSAYSPFPWVVIKNM